MASSLASAAARLVCSWPGVEFGVRKLALAPIGLKSNLFTKITSKISAHSRVHRTLIETNLGIADGLRVVVPSTKSDLAFGRPDTNVGERGALELVRLLAPRSAAFIDVGANEGVFTFAAAAVMEKDRLASIHVFEPDRELFQRVSTNLKQNGINAIMNNSAIGRTTGIATFFRNLTDDHMGSLTGDFRAIHDTQAVEVNLVSLADYMETHNVAQAFLKVDVEGAGVDVWDGIGKSHNRINWLVMEIIGPEWDANLPLRIISETGWHAFYIRDYDLMHWQSGLYDYLGACHNWLFCPSGPDTLRQMFQNTRFRVT
jgi:FkbM family methyltransferase